MSEWTKERIEEELNKPFYLLPGPDKYASLLQYAKFLQAENERLTKELKEAKG